MSPSRQFFASEELMLSATVSRPPSTNSLATRLCLTLPVLLCVTLLPAQSRKKDDASWRKDPYTQDKEELMQAAGYISKGPFPWGDKHDSAQIEHVLGKEVKLLWLETAHFRIGCSLTPFKIPKDREEKEHLLAELAELRKILPRIPKRPKMIDRWLRMHLFARRFENTYADFCKRLGVTDSDFPPKALARSDERQMGMGPYLGQPDKYTVLMFAKKSSCGHYTKTFLDQITENAIRHNFSDRGSLSYITCAEFAEGGLTNDSALHCEAVFNIVHGLIDGFRYYTHNAPHWFRQGLAHWYLRRVNPKHNVYGEYKRFDADPKMLWNWAPRVRARARYDHFPRAAEMLTWRWEDEKTLVDSMMVWSRVDYLMSLGDEPFAKFLTLMKGPIPMVGLMPTKQEILTRQTFALEQAWGLDAQSFDERWKAWVIAEYPKK